MNIVFVCTGNICRSPMAEGLFKKLLEECGREDITCSSAGLAAPEGSPASINAKIAAQELGVDISEHRSRLLTRAIARDADMIVCMTQDHYDILNRIIPEEKLYILGGGIDDPYGCDLEVYRACAEKIKNSLPILLDRIECKG